MKPELLFSFVVQFCVRFSVNYANFQGKNWIWFIFILVTNSQLLFSSVQKYLVNADPVKSDHGREKKGKKFHDWEKKKKKKKWKF